MSLLRFELIDPCLCSLLAMFWDTRELDFSSFLVILNRLVIVIESRTDIGGCHVLHSRGIIVMVNPLLVFFVPGSDLIAAVEAADLEVLRDAGGGDLG